MEIIAVFHNQAVNPMPNTIFKKGNVTLRTWSKESVEISIKGGCEIYADKKQDLKDIIHVLNAYLKEQGKK